MFHQLTVQGRVTETDVHKSQILEEKGEPKRGVEPASFRLAAERLNHHAKPAHKPGFPSGGRREGDFVWELCSRLGLVPSRPEPCATNDRSTQIKTHKRLK